MKIKPKNNKADGIRMTLIDSLFLTNWHDKKMNCPICLDEDDKYDEYD